MSQLKWFIGILLIASVAYAQVYYDEIRVQDYTIDVNGISTVPGVNIRLDPGAGGGISLDGTTSNRVLITNGATLVESSTVTVTELNRLSGVNDPLLTEASTIPLIQLEALTSNNIVITNNSGFLTDSFVDSSRVQYLDPVNSDLCGIDDSCTLTNKTLTSPVANLITLDGQTATPSTPSAGDVRFYSKSSDEKLYFLNSSGIEQEVGTGAGSSNNYFQDFNADQISNLTQFDDTSSGGDLDGGTATNLTVSSNASTPINKLRSYRISKAAADASWEGQRITFSGTQIDELAKSGKPFIFSFNYETSANYNAGTEAVSIYYYRVGVDSAAQACNGRTLGGSVSNTLGVATAAQSFSCSFNLTSNTTAVRIAWVVTGTGTSTWDLDIDNVYFGPDFQVPGVVQYYQEIPLDGSNNFTNGTIIVSRTGNHVSIRLTEGATFSSNSAPESAAGLIPEWARPNTANIENITRMNASFLAYMLVETDGTLSFAFRDWAGSLVAQTSLAAQAGISYAIVDNSSASLSTTQVDLLAPIAAGQNSAGQSLTADTTNVTFASSEVDPSNLFDGTTFTVPTTGRYSISGVLRFTAAAQRAISIYVNGTANKVIGRNSASDSILPFYGEIDATQGQALTVRVDTNSTVAAGIPLNNWISITGRPNLTTFGTYGLYEVVTAKSAVKTPSNTSHYHQLSGNSVTLTAGTWKLTGDVLFGNSGSSPTYQAISGGFFGGNGADSASLPTLVTALPGVTQISNLGNVLTPYLEFSGVANAQLPLAQSIISCSQSCTIFLVTFSQQSTSANARITASITAERLK